MVDIPKFKSKKVVNNNIQVRVDWTSTIHVEVHLIFSLVSSIKYVCKIFRKTNISNSLIRTCTCAYQAVRNISFSENFTYVLNGWPLYRSIEAI